MAEGGPRFLLPTRPEDLLRLTMPDDPRNAIAALLRYLQAARPSYQEQAWAIQAVIAAAPGTWFRLCKGGKTTGYLLANETSGRYASNLPDNLRQEDTRPLDIPEPPPTTLRAFLVAMIDRVAAHIPADAAPFLPFRAQATASEDDAGYLATREFAAALATGAGLGVPEAAVMETFAASLHTRFHNFALRGEVVGILLLLCAASKMADPARALTTALGTAPKAPVQSLAGFGDFVLDGVHAQPGGTFWIGRAAEALSDEAEARLDDATAARSAGAFYAEIYNAVPLAYGAKRGFGYLAQATEGAEAERARVRANQCDERFAYGMAALKAAFGNSMDSRFLLSHRALIERERRRGGEEVAASQAVDLIDSAMMYPAFFRPFLMGKTNTLAMTADAPVSTAAGSTG